MIMDILRKISYSFFRHAPPLSGEIGNIFGSALIQKIEDNNSAFRL